MSSWKRMGLVIKPNPNIPFMQSSCMIPTPYCVGKSLYKIFFGTRNSKNQSSICYALIDLKKPDKVLDYYEKTVLQPGNLGTFDDNGVLPSCLVVKDGIHYLYTIGFKPGGTTRMDLFGGLALSKNNGDSFFRWSEAPILERNKVNPYINTAPWVIKYKDKYIMYYVGCVEWVNKDLPRYNIQLAYSNDCINWTRNGDIAIDFEEGEDALARPYVVIEEGLFKMWFSSKGSEYIIKYAESYDGLKWIRKNCDFKLSSPIKDVDDKMTCYPVVLKYMNKTIMYYNGNNYGAEGICLAVKE